MNETSRKNFNLHNTNVFNQRDKCYTYTLTTVIFQAYIENANIQKPFARAKSSLGIEAKISSHKL